jgi:hypothetical protein
MTAAPEVGTEARCLQLFTYRHGEFTFRNDTVTTPDLDRCPSQDGHSKRYQPQLEKVAGNRHPDAAAALPGIKIWLPINPSQ